MPKDQNEEERETKLLEALKVDSPFDGTTEVEVFDVASDQARMIARLSSMNNCVNRQQREILDMKDDMARTENLNTCAVVLSTMAIVSWILSGVTQGVIAASVVIVIAAGAAAYIAANYFPVTR